MRTFLTIACVLLLVFVLASCSAWQSHPSMYRHARDAAQEVFDRHARPYQPEYLEALDAAKAVLARHYMIAAVDKVHGVVYAQSAVGANISTKYRTTAVARVYRVGDGQYSVEVRVKNTTFQGTATVHTDPEEVADFIQYRMEKRPRLIGLIMKMDGFKSAPTREELLDYSRNLALVKITPE